MTPAPGFVHGPSTLRLGDREVVRVGLRIVRRGSKPRQMGDLGPGAGVVHLLDVRLTYHSIARRDVSARRSATPTPTGSVPSTCTKWR